MLTARSNADTLSLDFQASSMVRSSPHLWHLKTNCLFFPLPQRWRLGCVQDSASPVIYHHVIDMNTILQEVPNTTIAHDAYTYNGLPCGICEATKALDRGQAHLLCL